MRSFRIALLQANFCSSFPEKVPAIQRIARSRGEMQPEDYQFNHRLLISLARKAAENGARLLLGAESYLDGWSYESGSLARIALTVPGPEIDELCGLAKELRVWMCVAAMENSGGATYNSAFLISSRGTVTGTYRKTHEIPSVLKRMPYTLGSDLPVFETPWGKAGILICHDRWYPENARCLRMQGAEFVLNPTASAVFSPHHKYHEIHRCVQRAQAYQNSLFWASCNSANHGGHSVVVGPDGSVIAEGSGKEDLVIADIRARAYDRFDFLANMRPNLYTTSSRKGTSL